MSAYIVCKRMFHVCVPAGLRKWIFDPSNPVASGAYAIKRLLERNARHEEIYDVKYYDLVDEVMAQSCEAIAQSIVTTFGPRTVLDVGCGTGGLIMALSRLGVRARGLEYSEAALRVCRSRGLDVKKFDLERDNLDGARVDLVVSTEVAEHLPSRIADRFVETLCRSAPVVVMTAATPGQGGTDHANEQPHEYWIEKFKNRGMTYDKPLSLTWRQAWTTAGTAPCYYRNVMIFASEASTASRRFDLHCLADPPADRPSSVAPDASGGKDSVAPIEQPQLLDGKDSLGCIDQPKRSI